MKYSVFTVMTPEYTPAQLVTEVSRLGYDGIEWRVKDTDPEYAREEASFWRHNRCTIQLTGIRDVAENLRDLVQEAGLETCCLATYLTPSERDNIETVMAAANVLGAPMLRTMLPRFEKEHHYPDLFEEVRGQLVDLQYLSAEYGVKVVVETHPGRIIPSASSAFRLVEGADPRYIGVIYDPGNLVCEGLEDFRMGLELLGPYLAHVHVKNQSWRPTEAEVADLSEEIHWRCEPCTISRGMVSWHELLSELGTIGYDGYLSFEDFSGELTSSQKLCFNLRYCRGILEQRI